MSKILKSSFLKTSIVLAILFVSIVINIYFDREITIFIEQNRVAFFDDLMLFITDAGLFIVTSALSAYLILTKRYKEFVLVALAAIVSLESAYLLKKVVQIPRPFIDGSVVENPLIHATGFSFPSLHAAFCISVIPFLKRVFKKRSAIWIVGIFFVIVAVSRTYLSVHYLSDIIFGGMIGYSIAELTIYLENKYQLYEKIIYIHYFISLWS